MTCWPWQWYETYCVGCSSNLVCNWWTLISHMLDLLKYCFSLNYNCGWFRAWFSFHSFRSDCYGHSMYTFGSTDSMKCTFWASDLFWSVLFLNFTAQFNTLSENTVIPLLRKSFDFLCMQIYHISQPIRCTDP